MKLFKRKPGNLGAFIHWYPFGRQIDDSRARWDRLIVKHALEVKPKDFEEFLRFAMTFYRGNLVRRSLKQKPHSADRRTLQRTMLGLRLYRKYVAELLTQEEQKLRDTQCQQNTNSSSFSQTPQANSSAS